MKEKESGVVCWKDGHGKKSGWVQEENQLLKGGRLVRGKGLASDPVKNHWGRR